MKLARLGALTALALSALASPALATFPGANGPIVYVHGGDLWVTDATGANPHVLIDAPSDTLSNPALSPDGTRLAYDDGTQLFVANADGSGPVALGASGHTGAAWSPTGDEIASTVNSTNIDVLAVPGGTVLRTFTAPTNHFLRSPAWRPGVMGTELGVIDDGPGQKGPDPTEVALLSDAGSLTDLTSTSDRPETGDLDWAPNGQVLAYHEDCPRPGGGVGDCASQTSPRLLAKPVPSGTTTVLTTLTTGSGVAYSPDGQQVVYAKDGSLYVAPAGGGTETAIASGITTGQVTWGPSPGIVVNQSSDEADANTADARCDTDAGTAGDQCTLRAAIQEANQQPGAQKVTFALAAGATITPASALPVVTGPITLDARGSGGGRVAVSGVNAGAGGGLHISASDSSVTHLDFAGFTGPAIALDGSHNTVGTSACPFPCNVIAEGSGPAVAILSGQGNVVDDDQLTGTAAPVIDLNGDGRTPNDADDSDAGPNGLRNFPVGVTAATDPATGTRIVSGVATNAQGATVTIYGQDAVGAARRAETQRYVGTTTVTAGQGFALPVPSTVPAGTHFFSATVTDATDGTSELSPVCGDPDGDGNPDTDGDGLCDDWETTGLDYDDDGTPDLKLGTPPYGADPTKKDLFLEVDAMAPLGSDTAAPSKAALDQDVAAFAAAPTPVALHISPGDSDGVDDTVPARAEMTTGTGPDSALGIKNGDPVAPCDGSFGTAADRAAAGCWKILGAKRLTFRWAIFGYDDTNNAASSGLAQAIGGSTLEVTLGAAHWPDAASLVEGGGVARCHSTSECRGDIQASTLMHEFGHLLGLHHGGADDLNQKPNYLSVMNYKFQFWNEAPAHDLDYSRYALPTLDQSALIESAGIAGGAAPAALVASWPTTTYASADANCNGNLRESASTAGAIDWDMSGEIEPEPAEILIAINVTDEDPRTCALAPLTAQNDWSQIHYSFRDQPEALRPPGTLSGAASSEPTEDDFTAQAALVDSDHDGVSNLVEACAAPAGSGLADADNDGLADVCDSVLPQSTPPPGGGGGGGGGGGATTPPDTTPPKLATLKLHPATLRLKHKPKSAKLTFTLSEPATVTVKLARKLAGRRHGKKCVAGRRHGKKCTVTRAVHGARVVGLKAGRNTITFTTRFAGKKLKAGRYVLTLVAADTAANASRPASVSVRVKR